MNSESYYQSRKEYNYYKKIVTIVQHLEFDSIIDVGANRSPVLEHIQAEKEKVLLDLTTVSAIEGIRNIQADFFTWTPDKEYDVVLCLQVLEHLDDPFTFAQKLLSITKKTLIVSVPYRWKQGYCKYHVQDPIDFYKVKLWMKRDPSQSFIIKDEFLFRLICVYTI